MLVAVRLRQDECAIEKSPGDPGNPNRTEVWTIATPSEMTVGLNDSDPMFAGKIGIVSRLTAAR